MKCPSCGATVNPADAIHGICPDCWEAGGDDPLLEDGLEVDATGQCFSDADPGL